VASIAERCEPIEMRFVAVREVARHVAPIGPSQFLANDQTMVLRQVSQPPQSEIGLLVNEVIRFAEKNHARVRQGGIDDRESVDVVRSNRIRRRVETNRVVVEPCIDRSLRRAHENRSHAA
jgi:hypothetical protein